MSRPNSVKDLEGGFLITYDRYDDQLVSSTWQKPASMTALETRSWTVKPFFGFVPCTSPQKEKDSPRSQNFLHCPV